MAKRNEEKQAAAAAAAADENNAGETKPDETAPPTADKPEPAPAKAKRQTVELADKATGFFDSETGFKLVRDQRKDLGTNVGSATQRALASGRLLIVGK